MPLPEAPRYPKRVVVKLRDEVIQKLSQIVEFEENGRLVLDLPAGLEVERLFTTLTPEELKELAQMGEQNSPAYHAPNFWTYFGILVPEELDPQRLADLIMQTGAKLVETAYVELRPKLACANFGSNPDFKFQEYLGVNGINIIPVWNEMARFPGADGEDINFIDIESSWHLEDPDLPPIEKVAEDKRNYDRPVPYSDTHHGTQVLKIIAAINNDQGCVGIVPETKSVRVVSYWPKVTNPSKDIANVSSAITLAANKLRTGGVLLIEFASVAEANGDTYLEEDVPVEVDPASFEAIRLATANDIVVVEPAGNTANDLDAFRRQHFKTLNRASSKFKDSGAIIVGAAKPSDDHSKRTCLFNFGSRVDCHAWGEKVYVRKDDPFDGTSAAAAITAGAAVSLLGFAKKTLKRTLRPRELRDILSNSASGINTPSADAVKKPIGVMPNMKNIMDELLK